MRSSRRRNIKGTLSKSKEYVPCEGEGSNEPLYPPKLRDCQSCGAQTANYYKCACCWKHKTYPLTSDAAWAMEDWGMTF